MFVMVNADTPPFHCASTPLITNYTTASSNDGNKSFGGRTTWYCGECGKGPNSLRYDSHCPYCGHVRDNSCRYEVHPAGAFVAPPAPPKSLILFETTSDGEPGGENNDRDQDSPYCGTLTEHEKMPACMD